MTATQSIHRHKERLLKASQASLMLARRGFNVGAVVVVMALSACATVDSTKGDASSLNSGDNAKRAFMISDAADKFSFVSAGDAKDCRSYAVFVGVAGLSTNVFAGPTADEKEAAGDVRDVWSAVFDRKSEVEQDEALKNRQDRVEARQNGSLEKLSAEKCIHPVLAELGYEMVEA